MSEYRPWLYDFYHLWSAGQLAATRGNPYDVASLENIMVELPGWNEGEFVFGFLQLPQTLWLYAFFSLFPFALAKVIWFAFHAALSAASIGVLRGVDVHSSRNPHPLFILIPFPFVWSNLFWGQYNTICLFSLLMSAQLWRSERYFVSGAVITLTLFKPHLCLSCLAYLSALALLNRRFYWIAGVGCGLALQTAAVLLLNPELFLFFLKGVSARSMEAVNLPGAAPVQLLVQSTGLPIIAQLASLLSVAMGIVFAFKDQHLSQQRFLLILMPLGVILAPYAWGHTFLLLLPVTLCLCQSLATYLPRFSPTIIALVYTILFIGSIIPAAEPYLAILPVAVGFYLLAHRLTLDF